MCLLSMGRNPLLSLTKCYRKTNAKPNIAILNIGFKRQLSTGSSESSKFGWRGGLLTAAGVAGGGVLAVIYSLERSIKAFDLTLHPAKLPWSHYGLFSTLDAASIRRGYQVYKQVCSACHSLQYASYRELVDVCLTEAEAKAEAEEAMVTDGPDENGNMYQRPGKLSDRFVSPYPNEEAARAANNGAYPPDLTLITLARHGGEDYIFHLLTGYTDPPAGVTLQEGQFYNPYFPGGAISMAKALYNEAIEYEDGTPATASQLAKDVCVFLKWVAEPEYDTRQIYFVKGTLILGMLTFLTWYMVRHKWSIMKTRKIVFKPVGKKKPH